jgi:hypothetical protein
MPFALVRWYVRALGSPLCPLGHLFAFRWGAYSCTPYCRGGLRGLAGSSSWNGCCVLALAPAGHDGGLGGAGNQTPNAKRQKPGPVGVRLFLAHFNSKQWATQTIAYCMWMHTRHWSSERGVLKSKRAYWLKSKITRPFFRGVSVLWPPDRAGGSVIQLPLVTESSRLMQRRLPPPIEASYHAKQCLPTVKKNNMRPLLGHVSPCMVHSGWAIESHKGIGLIKVRPWTVLRRALAGG